MVAAFDAGAVINPDVLSNQVEGAIIQGIGGALFEQLEFDNNRILNGRLRSIECRASRTFLRSKLYSSIIAGIPSSGAGESPITASAPSIGSALFAATGKRIRELPMLPALIEGGVVR